MHHFHARAGDHKAAERLYAAAVERARVPAFYVRLQVPDTVDGRFDLLILHAFLVMKGLKEGGLKALDAAFVTRVFQGFEDALREVGVGDFGIPHRIKTMADAFYGRVEAYERAGADEDALKTAILRNVYRGDEAFAREAGSLARYVLAAAARADSASLAAGDIDFGPLPEH